MSDPAKSVSVKIGQWVQVRSAKNPKAKCCAPCPGRFPVNVPQVRTPLPTSPLPWKARSGKLAPAKIPKAKVSTPCPLAVSVQFPFPFHVPNLGLSRGHILTPSFSGARVPTRPRWLR